MRLEDEGKLTFRQRCERSAQMRLSGHGIYDIMDAYGWETRAMAYTAISRGKKYSQYEAVRSAGARRRYNKGVVRVREHLGLWPRFDSMLLDLWHSGMDTPVIAKNIAEASGKPCNKNHVIGRLHRLRTKQQQAALDAIIKGVQSKEPSCA